LSIVNCLKSALLILNCFKSALLIFNLLIFNCFFAHAQSGCENIIHSGNANPLTWKICQCGTLTTHAQSGSFKNSLIWQFIDNRTFKISKTRESVTSVQLEKYIFLLCFEKMITLQKMQKININGNQIFVSKK